METVNFIELKLLKNLFRIAISNLCIYSLLFSLFLNRGHPILWGVFMAILLVFLASLIHIAGLKFGFWLDSKWMEYPLLIYPGFGLGFFAFHVLCSRLFSLAYNSPFSVLADFAE